MNLFDQQRSNRRRTWLVMVLFVAFLAFLGAGFDFYVLGQQGVLLPVGTLAAVLVGSISAVGGYLHGDRAVLASTGAISVARAGLDEAPDGQLKLRQLENVVEEMAIAAGLPKPRVYLVPDQDPNAFATGRDPQNASIAVTRGLLDVLNREQLQAVVGHEMSHIRNYDIRLMTIVAALVGSIVLLSDWAGRGMRYGIGGGGRRSGRGKGNAGVLIVLVVWVLAILMAPFLSRLLAMAVSRQREYLADASAAQLTRNPGALADALHTIEFAAAPTRSIKQGTAHLCIADPLGRAVTARDGYWADLFATHPPMVKRIARLREMAYAPNPNPQILKSSNPQI
jgi:heat shock protein HtpX